MRGSWTSPSNERDAPPSPHEIASPSYELVCARPVDDKDLEAERERRLAKAHAQGQLFGEALVDGVFSGISAGVGGAVLGGVFGFGGELIGRKGWKASVTAGRKTAANFAIMSGLYQAVHSSAKRIRGEDDWAAAAIAGCATGAYMSSRDGSMQSPLWGCISFAAFTVFLQEFLPPPGGRPGV